MSNDRPETEAVNADSFLDIVASVVSIMLIMVMMIGMRIKKTPIDAPLGPEAAQAKSDFERRQTAEQSVRGDVLRVAARLEDVHRLSAVHRSGRDMLATGVAALEQRIRDRRAKLDAPSQEDFDLARALSETRQQVEQLQRQRVAVAGAAEKPVLIESYPTPLSHTVDSDEVHFQLRNGRLAHVPLDSLLQKMSLDVQRKADRLREHRELSDTVGPQEGFRLRYTILWKEVSQQMAIETGRGGAGPELKQVTVIPVIEELGEPAEMALGPGSQFRQRLADLKPGRHTITVWVYPESFDAFRAVRKELYRLGFAVAGRPLPLDQFITGSPQGHKSAAQ